MCAEHCAHGRASERRCWGAGNTFCYQEQQMHMHACNIADLLNTQHWGPISNMAQVLKQYVHGSAH